jgi:hypothetical protein
MIFPRQMADELNKLAEKLSKDSNQLNYDLTKNLLSKAKEDLKEVENDDISIFHAIAHAYRNGFLTKEQKKTIVKELDELHKKIKHGKNNIVEFREHYSNLNLLITMIGQFLEHEEEYLDYEPGAGKREYIRLLDLTQSEEKKLVVDKAMLEVRDSRMYYGGKIIQGVEFHGFDVEIVGEHYSDKDSILRIYNERTLSSGNERYSYVAEPGKLSGKGEHYIKRYMGARNADSNITVKIRVPASMCWVRVERGVPAKFAIESRNIRVAPPKQRGFRLELRGELQWAA